MAVLRSLGLIALLLAQPSCSNRVAKSSINAQTPNDLPPPSEVGETLGGTHDDPPGPAVLPPAPAPAPSPNDPGPVAPPMISAVLDIKSGNALRLKISSTLPSSTLYAVRRSGPDGTSWIAAADGKAGHGSEQWSDFASWGGSDGLLATDLTKGAAYRFAVRAKLADGATSALSTEALGTPTRPAVPPEPENLVATIVDDAGIKNALIEWDSGGATTVGFTISYAEALSDEIVLPEGCKVDPAVGTTIPSEQIGNASSFKIIGLNPASAYFVRVCAVNDAMPADHSNGVLALVVLTSSSTSNINNKVEVGDGANAGDGFGYAVAVVGFAGSSGIGSREGFAAIGAPFHDFDGSELNQAADAGAAYVYQYVSDWNMTPAKVVAPSASNGRTAGDRFGNDVALTNEWLLIGAPGQDFDADGLNELADAGAVYTFKWEGGAWTYKQKVVANMRSSDARFGSAVAAHSTNAYVGAPGQDGGRGSVYRFTLAGDVWSYANKVDGEASGDDFGFDIASDVSSVIVGAPLHQTDRNGNAPLVGSGAAYVYQSSLALVQKLDADTGVIPSGRNVDDHFGHSVGIESGVAVVGAPGHDFDLNGTDPKADAGACYRFQYTGIWELNQKLVVDEPRRTAGDKLGYAVAVTDGARAKCGAPFHSLDLNGENALAGAGAVFGFGKSAEDAFYSVISFEGIDPRTANDMFGAAVSPEVMDLRAIGAPALGAGRPGRAQMTCAVVSGARAASVSLALLFLLPLLVSGLRIRFSVLLGLALTVLLACSESGLTGSGASFGTKGNSPVDDDDDTTNDGSKTDDKHAGEGDPDSDLNDFLEKGDSIKTSENGTTMQRFSVVDSEQDVDVTFIIDTSGSMDDEMRGIESSIDAFLSKLEKDERTKDVQLFILAGRDDHAFNPPSAIAGSKRFTFEGANHAVASHNALAVAKNFLSGTITAPRLKLRSKSIKHLVFVTDDEAGNESDKNPPGIPEATFRSYLEASRKDDEIRVHAIVCQDANNDCKARGSVYMSLANDDRYKGSVQDIRSKDWSPLLDALAEEIKSNISARFRLKRAVKDPDRLSVYLNKERLPQSKYDYDAEENTLTLDDGLVKDGDIVVIVYK